MSLLIVPDSMGLKLSQADAPMELCLADGRLLGYFTPLKAKNFKLDPGITQEEAERRLAEDGGRKLSEILRDLENRK